MAIAIFLVIFMPTTETGPGQGEVALPPTGMPQEANVVPEATAATVVESEEATAKPPTLPSWDWQLSAPFAYDRVVDVMDVDPDSIVSSDVAALKERGTYLICYVSVGTLESYRHDANQFPAAVIGEIYGDWPDERFLDIREIDTLLPLMEARFRACRDKGFDAVEPDNLDVHFNDSGFPITAADSLAYAKALVMVAKGMGLAIGQKNVPDLVPDLVGEMDFAIAESCFEHVWCDKLQPYLDAGKPVYGAEFTNAELDWEAACSAATEMGISLILKDRDLSAAITRCP
ncbi:endo alpha-1,4 polygalactosaminidase [Algicella marina]|uniref:Endo alpha-1,4 polygalactosaminidase n=1 Tax=Algicella marina TaxID=2683284 RepID=A0A6P1SX26_9RHOB|nr:endo alpha-1,4 polygalactosaminidase [Algicella marina]QHQ34220.1 endo alpha-1,4 polygalactosaminidase [Algicella marina]